MPAWRWVLSEPSTGESYELEINPSEGGTPKRAKRFEFSEPVGESGAVIVFQGPDEMLQTDVSGAVLSRSHLLALRTWFEKDSELTLTDDLGRVMTILLTSFEPSRVRSNNYRWRHGYNMSYVVLAEVSQGTV